MQRILVYGFNLVCIVYAALLTLVFELSFVCYLPFFLLARKGKLDDAGRYHNSYYGVFMVTLFWPIIRIRREGMQHFTTNGPVMMVTNHRSVFDIFFFALLERPNVAVLVRSWPFRLPLIGRFMRSAGYIDIENQGFESVVERVRRLAARGVSSLCFVEGHRSHDGRLQRFRSGAFRLAVRCDLPVLPICITGTERICAPGSRLIRPACVDIQVLSPVDTTSFPIEQRAWKLRRHVESMFRAQLGE